MKVIWTPEAEQDRLDIWAYIAADDPPTAVRMDELFSAAAASLKDFPDKGKSGLIVGTRELIPHENYRLVYQIENDAVWIFALVQVARMWPSLQGWAASQSEPPRVSDSLRFGRSQVASATFSQLIEVNIPRQSPVSLSHLPSHSLRQPEALDTLLQIRRAY